MSKPPRQLDSRIEIVTPENIAFHYVLAGPFRRLPAYLIDLFIRASAVALMVLATVVSGIAGMTGLWLGVLLVTWFVLSWFYGGLFETLWNGQTPGKRALGLRVLSVDGQPINAMQAVLRNVLRDVDALPIIGTGWLGIPLFVLGLVAATSNRRYQRLGDLACRTIVVVERRDALRGLADVGRPEVRELEQQLPPSFVASRSMAQALSVYVSRRQRFSYERRQELARALADPLVERLHLAPDTNPDLLLCALYYRVFIADRPAPAAVAATGPPLVETVGV